MPHLTYGEIYVHDLVTGSTTWTSPLPDGSPGQNGCQDAALSADGRYVAFSSYDAHVVGDIGFTDVFVRDIQSGTVVRGSTSFNGGQANGNSALPVLSGDGRYVLFASQATDVIINDVNVGTQDIFLHDFTTGSNELIDVSSAGAQGNAHAQGVCDLTPDARFVVFLSSATNLVASDTNGWDDVFVRDRVLGTTERVNVSSSGNEADYITVTCSLSDDGRFVAFASAADNLVTGDHNGTYDVFVHDRATGQTTLASLGANDGQTRLHTTQCRISGDGRYVAFQTGSGNLLPYPNSNGIYIRDLWMQTTRIASVNASGVPGDQGGGYSLDFSGDGKLLVYVSPSNNLAPYPPNNWPDVFVVRHEELSPAVYCTATPSSSGCAASMSFSGIPSASAGSGFVLSVAGLPPERNATLLYGHSLPATLPYAGGTLCVTPPLKRMPLATSHGFGSCGSGFSQDFNAWTASGVDPALVNGRPVWIQCWTRDPLASASGTLNLSDAVYFVIDP